MSNAQACIGISTGLYVQAYQCVIGDVAEAMWWERVWGQEWAYASMRRQGVGSTVRAGLSVSVKVLGDVATGIIQVV
jgi:hypothetical protein